MSVKSKVAAIAAGVLVLMLLGQAAKADSYQFSFQSIPESQHDSRNPQSQGLSISGSGTFDASPQCTQQGTYGSYTVTSLEGQLTDLYLAIRVRTLLEELPYPESRSATEYFLPWMTSYGISTILA